MSINNVAHVASVDKGLKMKIKRTKGPNKVDSKHEVVKTESRAGTPTSGQPISTTSPSSATFTPSSSNSSFNNVVTAVATSKTPGTFQTVTSAALVLSSSSSSLSSISSSSSLTPSTTPSNIVVSSHVTMAVTNPTVALLKSVGAGMIISDTPGGNSGRGKSPSKTGSPDAKDGKSPKTKAAYHKKVKEMKGKVETTVPVSSSLSPVTNSQPIVDTKTCVSSAPGIQNFSCPQPPTNTSLPAVSSPVTSEPCPGDIIQIKKENIVHDPYEFNAKVEDKIELPPKKLKLEKADCPETAMSPQPPSSPTVAAVAPQPPPTLHQPEKRSVGVDVLSVGVVTEPDCLGPCEPGTLVGLEGIVWKETDNGLLVVNVTWRGKTYVGTLMDATRYAWAPPRPNGCESPVSDFESRTPKGRGKRNCRNSAQQSDRLPEGRSLRKGRRGTVNSSSSNFTAPPSPAKSDLCSNSLKRKSKPIEGSSDKSKRSRSCSRGVTSAESPTPDDYITCPEPNCHKKYKHMNGLRYHRTHAHQKSLLAGDSKDDEDEDEDDDDDKQEKKEKTTLSERSERMKAKEKQKIKERQRTSDRESRDSLDDDIPLKEIANKVSGQNELMNKVDEIKDKCESEANSNDAVVAMECNTSEIDAGTESSNHQNNTVPSSNTNSTSSLCPETGSISKSEEMGQSDKPACSTSLVPSVSIANEDSLQIAVSANRCINVPLMTSSVTSHGLQALPTMAACDIAHGALNSTSNKTTAISQTFTTNSESVQAAQANTTISDLTHIPQNTTFSGYTHNQPSSIHNVYSQLPQVSANGGLIQTSQGITNSGFVQILKSTTSNAVSAQTLPVITCTTSQVNATIQPPGISATSLAQDRQNGGKSSGFPKAVTVVRPIVPAPSPQLSSTNSAHPQTFNSQLATQSLISSTLKPIQPRPTIMGDYPAVSPALSDLNRDKLKKHKKKKEKGSPGTTPVGQIKLVPKVDAAVISRGDKSKNERPTVLSSPNPCKLFETTSTSNVVKTQFHSSLDSSSLLCTTSNELSHPVLSRLAIPPSTLSLSSFTADKQINSTDDVHSPAYSDISDANDSNSPLRQESPRKDSSQKKEHQMNASSHLSVDGNSHPQHFGGMFNFGGPPYYLPHGVSPQGVSPTLPKRDNKSEEVGENKACGTGENQHNTKDESRSAQELEIQQNSFMNYYAHIHGVSPASVQFQLNFAGYNSPALDPSYAMPSQQALVAEQKRFMQDHTNRPDDSPGQRLANSMSSANRHNGPNYDYLGSKVGAGIMDGQIEMKRASDDKDQANRLKHNESRQITQENIDVKSHIGQQHQLDIVAQDHPNQNNYQSSKQHNFMLNHQKYQQQRHKVPDSQNQDKRTVGESPNSGHVLTKSRQFQDIPPQDIISADTIKKEVPQSRDTLRPESKLDAIDSKRVDFKEENPQTKGSSSTHDHLSRSRPASQSGTPNIPPANTSTSSLPSLPSPIAASFPVSLVAPIPPYASYYPHFRSVPLDPVYRAISPHIIGYASPVPGYIHHPQLGFRMPAVDADRKSSDTTDPQRGDAGTASNTPVHKIHELHEKGRPSPGIPSPALTKPQTGAESVHSQGSATPAAVLDKMKDKQREYSSSPPTQRHVHTHHHTHVVKGFPPLYPPDAYSAMFGHPAAAAAAIQTSPHPFPAPPKS